MHAEARPRFTRESRGAFSAVAAKLILMNAKLQRFMP